MKTEASMNTKPCGNLSVADKKAAVLARWPDAHCVLEGEQYLILPDGLDVRCDYIGRGWTEDDAWSFTYDCMYKLPYMQAREEFVIDPDVPRGQPVPRKPVPASAPAALGPSSATAYGFDLATDLDYPEPKAPATVPVASPEAERAPLTKAQLEAYVGMRYQLHSEDGERESDQSMMAREILRWRSAPATVPVASPEGERTYVRKSEHPLRAIRWTGSNLEEVREVYPGITTDYMRDKGCGVGWYVICPRPGRVFFQPADMFESDYVQASRASLPVGELPPLDVTEEDKEKAYPRYERGSNAGCLAAQLVCRERQFLTTQSALAQAEERIAGLTVALAAIMKHQVLIGGDVLGPSTGAYVIAKTALDAQPASGLAAQEEKHDAI